jgi:gluconate 2-dehydrogenase subunit 3-like protein
MSETNEVSRRDLLRVIGSSMVLTTSGVGVLSPALAQHVHTAISELKSLNGGADYQPKHFTQHNFQTMRKLGDLIIPVDDHSPGASDAGAAEFIDFLCSRNDELAHTFDGGLAWMDDYMRRQHGTDFIESKANEQIALLDLLAYRKNNSPEIAPGQRFFVWARNMVVDAFYTSPAGVKDIGFLGNTAVSQFSVPKEAVEYALKRSPFANEA